MDNHLGNEDIEKIKAIVNFLSLNYVFFGAEIDEMFPRILSDEFREKCKDSFCNS
jgi:hypothetical protein